MDLDLAGSIYRNAEALETLGHLLTIADEPLPVDRVTALGHLCKLVKDDLLSAAERAETKN